MPFLLQDTITSWRYSLDLFRRMLVSGVCYGVYQTNTTSKDSKVGVSMVTDPQCYICHLSPLKYFIDFLLLFLNMYKYYFLGEKHRR